MVTEAAGTKTVCPYAGQMVVFFPMYIFVIFHVKDIVRELCISTVACPCACFWQLLSLYEQPK